MSLRPRIERLRQQNLFLPRPATPTWRGLPSEVRRKTLPLLARLLRSSRLLDRAVEHDREVGDE